MNAPQQVQAFFARGGVTRVVQIDQDEVEVLPAESTEDLWRRSDQLGGVTLRLEEQAQSLEDVSLVIGNEDSRHRGSLCRALEYLTS